MPQQQLTDDQRASGRSREDRSGEPICARCQAAMSRRLIRKPDTETGLSDVTFRCPKCGAMLTLWMRRWNCWFRCPSVTSMPA